MNKKVSIICNTYNHDKYIKDALDSFLMQRTNFAFEVLIHDDASTDNTADIIRKYEREYPNIIKPLYQKENKYSQGLNISLIYQFPRVEGKYIAICEGDDYWTDPFKLQKQFNAMERHPEIDICAHTASVIKAFNGKIFDCIKPSNRNTVFDVADVINGGGGFVATNSLFYRKKLNINIPEFRIFYPIDYTLQIHGALRGGMLYLSDNMSVYRSFVANSWTDRMKNCDLRKKHHDKMIKMYALLNDYTKNKFFEIIEERILEEKYLSVENSREYALLETSELKDWYSKKPIKWKLKRWIKRYMPYIVETYKDIKSKY